MVLNQKNCAGCKMHDARNSFFLSLASKLSSKYCSIDYNCLNPINWRYQTIHLFYSEPREVSDQIQLNFCIRFVEIPAINNMIIVFDNNGDSISYGII